MKFPRLILALGALLSATACSLTLPWLAKPTAQPNQTARLGTAAAATTAATTKADTAAATVDTKLAERDAKLRANVDAAKAANQDNADGPAKVEVDGELGVAQSRLVDTPADPAELAAAASRKLLVESGKTAEARASYAAAAADGKKLTADLATAKAERDQAQRDRDAARAAEEKTRTDFLAQLEQNRLSNQHALDALNEQHRKDLAAAHNEVLRKQVFYLNIAGGVCLLVFAVAIGFGGLAGARVGWPFALFGPLCFGLAQIVSQPWFLWACLGVVVIAVGVAIWWVWKHYRLGTLQADTEKKAAQLQTVVHDVVPVLDRAYESADDATKKLLDSAIFSPLAEKMDTAAKNVVTAARAIVNTVPAPTAAK